MTFLLTLLFENKIEEEYYINLVEDFGNIINNFNNIDFIKTFTNKINKYNKNYKKIICTSPWAFLFAYCIFDCEIIYIKGGGLNCNLDRNFLNKDNIDCYIDKFTYKIESVIFNNRCL